MKCLAGHVHRRRALKNGLLGVFKEGGRSNWVRILPFFSQMGPNLDLPMAYGQSAGPYLKNEPSLRSLRGLGAEKRVFWGRINSPFLSSFINIKK